MSFLTSGQAASDTNFKLRVQAALVKIAQAVYGEPLDTPNYDKRRLLALAAAVNSDVVVNRFIWLCATNANIASTITVSPEGVVDVAATDAVIEAVCTNLWNPVANFGR